ncbi:MAG: hypothetical protein JWP91_4633 [Fibrobacteres bacterium]|nr:hypothetical protein [Fibrobacterota bacterium]
MTCNARGVLLRELPSELPIALPCDERGVRICELHSELPLSHWYKPPESRMFGNFCSRITSMEVMMS